MPIRNFTLLLLKTVGMTGVVVLMVLHPYPTWSADLSSTPLPPLAPKALETAHHHPAPPTANQALKATVTKLPKHQKNALYSPYYAFLIEPPIGWVLDRDSGHMDGLKMVLYPKGTNWNTSDSVMYVNTILKTNKKKRETPLTLQAIIEADIQTFKKAAPQLDIEEGDTLVTGDDKKPVVKYFRKDKYGNQEAVAYIDEPQAVIVMVLSSRSHKHFQAHLPHFESWVNSYRAVDTLPSTPTALRRYKKQKASQADREPIKPH